MSAVEPVSYKGWRGIRRGFATPSALTMLFLTAPKEAPPVRVSAALDRRGGGVDGRGEF